MIQRFIIYKLTERNQLIRMYQYVSQKGSEFPSVKTKLSATTLSHKKNVSKLFPILNTLKAKLVVVSFYL